MVIPTYNSGGLVLETIESVVRQSRPADQIIVVDDGSTDETPARIAQDFSQVTLVTTANRGRSAARNLGLAQATQRWVCFLDHDDLWHRDKLAHTERYLADHPTCRALRHPVWWFSATPNPASIVRDGRRFRGRRPRRVPPGRPTTARPGQRLRLPGHPGPRRGADVRALPGDHLGHRHRSPAGRPGGRLPGVRGRGRGLDVLPAGGPLRRVAHVGPTPGVRSLPRRARHGEPRRRHGGAGREGRGLVRRPSLPGAA